MRAVGSHVKQSTTHHSPLTTHQTNQMTVSTPIFFVTAGLPFVTMSIPRPPSRMMPPAGPNVGAPPLLMKLNVMLSLPAPPRTITSYAPVVLLLLASRHA